jgi:Methyltransferase FkbM domain
MGLPLSRSSSPRSTSSIFLQQNAWIVPWLLFVLGCSLGHFHGRYASESERDQTWTTRHSLSTTPAPPPPPSTSSTRQSKDGWHSIDVFYGRTDLLEVTLPPNQTWFSQASQDELVIALLGGKRNGYFIDLAANDAVDLSNTYALERHYGWDGVCIEPNPIYWHTLSYRQCRVVGAVVGRDRNEQVYFRFEAGDHGGIAGDGFNNGKRWQRSSQAKYTVTLLEILEHTMAPTDIDYLSLDVEGAESFILMNFPLDKYRIKIITAERLKGPIRAFLKEHGFTFVKKLTKWGESLWVHRSVMESLDMSAIDRFKFQE